MLRRLVVLIGTVCTVAIAAPSIRAASTLPSIQSSNYPYYQTLAEYTFDSVGNPDEQGWTTHDLTAQAGTFWHVDDFTGLSPDYSPSTGKAMWCGVRPGVLTDPSIQHAPGYGSGWAQILETNLIATTPDDVQVILTCLMRWNLASGDHLDVEYRHLSGSWGLLQRFTAPGPAGANPIWYVEVDPFPSSIQFRFVFVSDFQASDEDGTNTNGAFIIDNIFAQTATRVILPDETFEFYPSGTTQTIDWKAAAAPAFGNYGALVSGSTVAQSGTANTTHVWSFFNGSAATYACGGYPAQAAVPGTSMPGSRTPADYLWNEARSPWIDLSVDENAQPVDTNMGAIGLEYDVYADLNAATNGVRYTHRYRFMVGGVVQEWHMDPTYRSSDVPQWVHEDVGSLGGIPIPPGATHVQLGLVALDYAYATGVSGLCHSPAPLFDNVIVHRMFEPLVVYNTNPSGPGSLEQAVSTANFSDNTNSILFDIPGDGPHTIATPGVTFTSPVWIDGFSQPGSVPNIYAFLASTAQMKIVLDGTNAGSDNEGMLFAAGSQGVVRGLVIGGYAQSGIRHEGGPLAVTGCYIGTDVWGNTANPNGAGIVSNVFGISIGGPANEERMVVSGNQGHGITLNAGSGPIFNTYVGFDSYGQPMGNATYGIWVSGGTAAQIGQPAFTECLNGGEYTDRMRIGYNQLDGVRVEPAATGVMISQVHFDGNGLKPIELHLTANGGVTPPVLTSAGASNILGTTTGIPFTVHHVEFFAGPACNTKRYLGYQDVTIDGSGNGVINFSCMPIPPFSEINATNTVFGRTSELSSCILSVNTPPGSPAVTLYDEQNIPRANVEFDDVVTGGNTTLTPASPSAPSGYNIGSTPQYWNISTTAVYSGNVQITLFYDPNQVPGPESMLRLLHLDNGIWMDITTEVVIEDDRIVGVTTSLSPFVLAVPSGATGMGDQPVPETFALGANVPNPFNPVTTISYDVPGGGADVTIAIFDVRGALVQTLVNERRAPGRYTVQWNGDDRHGGHAASGVYFYRMRAGSFMETKKMVLLK